MKPDDRSISISGAVAALIETHPETVAFVYVLDLRTGKATSTGRAVPSDPASEILEAPPLTVIRAHVHHHVDTYFDQVESNEAECEINHKPREGAQ